MFGAQSYGTSTSGALFYPAAGNQTGCGPITGPNFPPSAILLLDRGGCTYTSKALQAQYAGAAGLVIVDTADMCGVDIAECGEEDCWGCPYFEVGSTCVCGLHMMGDDGKGTQGTLCYHEG